MLVRYCGEYTIFDLERDRLSVSKVSKFNDPFELFLISGAHPTRQTALELIHAMLEKGGEFLEQVKKAHPELEHDSTGELRKELEQGFADNFVEITPALAESLKDDIIERFETKTRVMCLAREIPHSPLEIPMWGYYANAHKGMRLHFSNEFMDDKRFELKPIVYVDTPPQLEFHWLPLSREFLDFGIRVLTSKSAAWAHEGETRLGVRVRDCFVAKDQKRKDRDFIPIELRSITRIDLGVNCSPSLVNRVLKMRNRSSHLQVWGAERRVDCYGIRYVELA